MIRGREEGRECIRNEGGSDDKRGSESLVPVDGSSMLISSFSIISIRFIRFPFG